MGYVLTVSGTPFVPDATTFSIDAALEQRTTFDFVLSQTVPASFFHVTQGMPVLVTNNGVNVFRGVVDTADEVLVSNYILQTTVRCSDNHQRADRRLAVKTYLNTACGDMASDLSTSYLAAEAVVGRHLARTETTQTDWQTVNGGGGLSGNLDATTSPGDLKLHNTAGVYAASGQRISPALDLTGVDQARVATVSWTQTLNGQTITIETSTDGGSTWQTVTNGGSIPQINLWQAPIIEGFDADNSLLYSVTGSGSWTWDVANSQLIGNGSGGGITTLIATSALILAKDTLLQADVSQAGGIGFVARYTDANNYYFTEAYDDGAVSNANTVKIFKRVAGTNTQLASVGVNLHRGDIHRLGFQVQGTALSLLVDGVVVASATDSSLTAAGQVGARLPAVADTSYVLNVYGTVIATSLSGVSLLVRQTLAGNTSATPVLSDLTVSIKSALVLDGPVVPSAVFSYVKVSDALDALATRAGYTWWIDADNKLHFVPRTTAPAPFMVSSTNGVMLADTVKVTHGNPVYRNTQYITGGVDQTSTQTESQKGDSSSRSFVLRYPVASVPTVTVNAVSKTVGILGVDTGKDWYWQAGSDTISQDSGGTLLTSSDTLQVVYVGQFPVVTSSQDYAGVLTTQATEGDGSGIVEEVEVVPESTTAANSFQIAGALLNKYSIKAHTLTFDTDYSGFKEGQLLYAKVPEHGLNGIQFLITQVRTYDKGGADPGNLRYTVTAVEGPVDGGWIKLFANIIAVGSGSDSINLGSSTTVTVLIPATNESYTWGESVVETVYACPIPSTSLFPGTTLFPC